MVTSMLREQVRKRSGGRWAARIERLHVDQAPPGAINLNVEGRPLLSALQGFGSLWRRTYRIRLAGIDGTPQEVMQIWRLAFSALHPPGKNFHLPARGVEPGEVIWIDAHLPVLEGAPEIVPMASGVVVIFVDEISFTIMTPQGFPEAGWNTFSVYEEDGVVVAQVQSLARATDPIYEFGFRFMGGAHFQEETWIYTLTGLGMMLGVQAPVTVQSECIDPRWQWSEVDNLWYNAAIRSFFHVLATPLRRIKNQKLSIDNF